MLSIIIIGEKNNIKIPKNIEIIYYKDNLLKCIENATNKYITFICKNDTISEDYFKEILEKTKEDFDSCYINYKINYDYKKNIKVLTDEKALNEKPYLGQCLWNYVFNRQKLISLLKSKSNFNEQVDKLFQKNISIGKVIYTHNPQNSQIEIFPYKDVRKTKHYKNIIYVGFYCNTIFNGYVTWIENLGKCFKNYDITILYDVITDAALKKFTKYFKCVKRNEFINYTCDRLIVTYSTFYYPKNIYPLEENYLFIHGNMRDYDFVEKEENDIYTRYIAVSKTSAKKAEGYYNTDKIDYIYNPFKIDEDIKPHLRLISAQRSADVKKLDRIEKFAKILDEENIPYTWNVFTDSKEGTNVNGLIYRKRTTNPYPYIKDSDYFILLSDSEACPYSIIEALSLHTKVIVTPLEVYKELGVNEKNGTYIPFEYFEDNNKEKLRKIIQEIYQKKDNTFTYHYDEKLYEDYKKIFK